MRKSFPFQVEQIKRNEDALTAAKEQITKHWLARVIGASNLAIEDGAFDVKMCSERRDR